MYIYSIFHFLPYMLLVFCYLALAYVSQSIVLVMLGEVKSYLLAVCRYAHGQQLVYKPITHPTHYKCIDKDYHDGEQVIQEDHETIPCAGYQSLLYEYACEHGAEYAARAVCGEYIQSIIDSCV